MAEGRKVVKGREGQGKRGEVNLKLGACKILAELHPRGSHQSISALPFSNS